MEPARRLRRGGFGAATLTPGEGQMRTSERDGGKLLSHALRDRFKFQMLDEPVNLLPNRSSSRA